VCGCERWHAYCGGWWGWSDCGARRPGYNCPALCSGATAGQAPAGRRVVAGAAWSVVHGGGIWDLGWVGLADSASMRDAMSASPAVGVAVGRRLVIF
jgi:hypothetical protein